MKRCVIFDMDGVIINSEPIHQELERKIFIRLGINVTKEIHHTLVGATDEYLWTQLGKLFRLPYKVPDIIKLKKSLYLDHLKQDTSVRPIPYVTGLIEELHRNNFFLVLASSSPHEQIEYILNIFKIRHYFHATISGEDVDAGKPDPEMFIKAAGLVKCHPDNCVVIEDTCIGVTAAKRAKMKCIGFINPDSGNQDLTGSDIILNSFKELSVLSVKELLLQTDSSLK
jgi:HAD superfamily hydrolase (TIGR01509 family)